MNVQWQVTIMTTFFRVLDVSPEGKPTALLDAISAEASSAPGEGRVFTRDPSSFLDVPGVAILYWLSDNVLKLYQDRSSWVGFDTRCGLGTLDDFQFLRCWWEVGADAKNWHPLPKGGSYSPYYLDTLLAIKWDTNGRGLKASVEQKVGSASRKIQGEDHYFLPGITWPRRPHNLGSFQILASGSIYSDSGPGMFANNFGDLLFAVAILNSAPYLFLLDSLMPRGSEGGQTLKYETGYVTAAPLPAATPSARTKLAKLARRAWSLARSKQTEIETARAFVLPRSLLAVVSSSVGLDPNLNLMEIQNEVDEIAFELYGISGQNRELINSWCRRRRSWVSGPGESDAPASNVTQSVTLANLSWLIGVAFGRFDLRLATKERLLPAEPEPFDPLPSRSPGMWPENETTTQRPDILVDDNGHYRDIVTVITPLAERICVDLPENLGGWLADEFFAEHIRMYSESRRKAPIYWQLATSSASYSVWLYIHAFNTDTLFRVQSDYVAPKLAHEDRRLESMKGELGEGGTAAQRKEMAAQEAFVDELRAFVEEISRVAPLWNPNLDDGVIINFAPLWRLVPQHRAWQKELKATWDALCSGDYDWSHLAMHLWPERVVPKCATDRGLAIAHRLEDVFWVEAGDGKWKPRETSTRPTSALIAERSSAAVKAALKSLMEAPDPAGSTKRARKSKAA